MAWLAVNKDGTEWIMPEKPVRGRCGHWEYLEEVYNVPIEIELPKGTVYKLLGKELTWDDEPVELQTKTEKGKCSTAGVPVSARLHQLKSKTDTRVRYPLLFPNRHSYRFLRKYPLYISAAPYPFISNGHSCKGGFSALFQGRLRPFFLYLFFSLISLAG